MAFKAHLDPDALRKARAEILLSTSGSYAAVEAIMMSAAEHRDRAKRDADGELAEHWAQVVDILWVAKNKIGALT